MCALNLPNYLPTYAGLQVLPLSTLPSVVATDTQTRQLGAQPFLQYTVHIHAGQNLMHDPLTYKIQSMTSFSPFTSTVHATPSPPATLHQASPAPMPRHAPPTPRASVNSAQEAITGTQTRPCVGSGAGGGREAEGREGRGSERRQRPTSLLPPHFTVLARFH